MVGALLRSAVAIAAAGGLLLGWSSYQGPYDPTAWRQQQMAEALESAALEAVAGAPEYSQSAESADTLDPVPVPSSHLLQETTPRPIATPSPYGMLAIDCDGTTPGVQASCTYDSGNTFTIQIHAAGAPVDGYYGFQASLHWTGGALSYLPSSSAATEGLWSGCSAPARSDGQPEESSVVYACVPIPPLTEPTRATGPLVQFEMSCDASETASLALTSYDDAGALGTYFFGERGDPVPAALGEALVTCATSATPTFQPPPPPLPTPEPDIDNLPRLPKQRDLPARPGVVVEKEIGLSGGTIASTDGRVVVEFPAEAVTERLNVRITHKSVHTLEPMLDHPFMTAWEFEAFAVDRRMAKVERFPENVRIIANYTLDDLVGRNPDTLRLWTWNEDKEAWEELPSQHIPNTGTLVTEVNHFSLDVGTADPAVFSPAFLRSFQTDLHTGAGAVTLPIGVPPGRAGLTPTLTLNYSSNRVNEMKQSLAQGSWTGIGWDLSVGSIRTVFATTPDQPTRMRHFMELNGVGTEIVQDPSQPDIWRATDQQYVRIRQEGPSGQLCTVIVAGVDAPCYWVVTDKLGTQYFFGGTSLGPDSNAARYYDYLWTDNKFRLFYYRWDLRKVVDTHGNRIEYEYDQEILADCPSLCHNWVFASYPEHISYNYVGSSPKSTVTFNLAQESTYTGFPSIPLRDDAPRNMLPSGQCAFEYHIPNKVEDTRKLDSIDIEFNGGRVRRYEFQYSETPFQRFDQYPSLCNTAKAGELRLEQFRQLGKTGTGSGSALYNMTFDYDDLSFHLQGDSGPVPFTNFTRPFLGEVSNGFDGRAFYEYIPQQVDNITGDEKYWSSQVVEERRLSPDTGGVIPDMVTTYQYDEGPAYFVPCTIPFAENCDLDYVNGEFRGFGSVTEIRGDGPTSGPFVEHDFFTGTNDDTADERVLSGREKESRAYDFSGADLWRKTVNTWGVRQVDNCLGDPPDTVCAVNFISLDQVKVHDGVAPNVVITKNEFYYDAWGNLEIEWQLGIEGDGSDNRTVWHPYHAATVPWIFLPQYEHVYEGKQDLTWLQDKFDEQRPAEHVSETTFFYDGSNLWNTPPTTGDLTGMHRWYGLPNIGTNVYYQYDPSGNKIRQSNPTSVRIVDNAPGYFPSGVGNTFWDYSDQGLAYVYPKEITGPSPNPGQVPGHTTALAWDAGLGAVKTRTEPTGRVVEFRYDNFGRLEKTWDNFDSFDNPTTWFEYNWVGGFRNQTIVHRRQEGSTYLVERTCFDGFGRQGQTRVNTKPNKQSVVETNYTGRGLQDYVSEPVEVAVSYDCDRLTGSFPKTEFAHNPLDEVSLVANPAAGALPQTYRTISRDGLTTTTIDENGEKTVTHVDGFGRLTSVDEFNGGAVAATTIYDYDRMGNLTKVTDDAANVTTMTYDELARKTQMNDPDMGIWTYQYDPIGNLTEQKDAKIPAQYVSMVYDQMGRVTRKCYSTHDACLYNTAPPVAFSYDSYDDTSFCGAGNAAKGNLTKMVDHPGPMPGTTRWCHDIRGRVTKDRHTVDGTNYTINRTFDKADHVTSLTYPDGEVVEQGHSALSGQPNSLYNSVADYVDSATYGAGLRLEQMTLGDDGAAGTTTYDYDERNRLKLTDTHVGSEAAQILTYAYDGVGNVTAIADWRLDETDIGEYLTPCYDFADRLTRVYNDSFTTQIPNTTCDNGGFNPWAQYIHSNIGNLTFQGEPGVNSYLKYNPTTPHPMPHAVASIHTSATFDLSTRIRKYEYDANGNLLGTLEGDPAGFPEPDDDNDMISDVEESQFGTDPNKLDTDRDGCTDAGELGPNEVFGGRRDPTDFWDLFDTPDATSTTLSTTITATATPPFTITVASADSFPSIGTLTLYIDNEKFSYDTRNIQNDTFHITGRALGGTTAAAHAVNAPVVRNVRDKSVSGLDLFAVTGRFNSTGNPNGDPLLPPPPSPAYHTAFDHSAPVAHGDPWDSTGPDGSISGLDFFNVLAQFNQTCAYPPSYFARYGYDQENRLIHRAGDGVVTRYVYDGQGTLVKKIDDRPGQNPEPTVYAGGIYEKNLATSEETTYYWFNGRRVAMRMPDNTRRFLLSDHLGSTSMVRTASGGFVGEQKYYPYGRVRDDTGTMPTDKLFTGHQKEGSLYFMQARFYDPALGRFIQPDSIVPNPGNPQALNRYSYVLGNPLLYTDPTGYLPCPGCGWVADRVGDAGECLFQNQLNCVRDPIAGLWDSCDFCDALANIDADDLAAALVQLAQDLADTPPGQLVQDVVGDVIDLGAQTPGTISDAVSAGATGAKDFARTPVGAATLCVVGGPVGCGVAAAANGDRIGKFAARFATMNCLGFAVSALGLAAQTAALATGPSPLGIALAGVSAGAYYGGLMITAQGSSPTQVGIGAFVDTTAAASVSLGLISRTLNPVSTAAGLAAVGYSAHLCWNSAMSG